MIDAGDDELAMKGVVEGMEDRQVIDHCRGLGSACCPREREVQVPIDHQVVSRGLTTGRKTHKRETAWPMRAGGGDNRSRFASSVLL
jgi:hypothetical protein